MGTIRTGFTYFIGRYNTHTHTHTHTNRSTVFFFFFFVFVFFFLFFFFFFCFVFFFFFFCCFVFFFFFVFFVVVFFLLTIPSQFLCCSFSFVCASVVSNVSFVLSLTCSSFLLFWCLGRTALCVIVAWFILFEYVEKYCISSVVISVNISDISAVQSVTVKV